MFFHERLQTGIEHCAVHELLAKLHIEQLGPVQALVQFVGAPVQAIDQFLLAKLWLL